MRRLVLFLVLGCTVCFAPEIRRPDDPYVEIPIREVYGALVVRDAKDTVCSGQIKSEKGLAEFLRIYKVDARIENVDFRQQMLVIGMTDLISTRAFRLLKNKKTQAYCLDYYDTGAEYLLKEIGEGQKYSYIQGFLVERLDGVKRVQVKNLLANTTSKTYE